MVWALARYATADVASPDLLRGPGAARRPIHRRPIHRGASIEGHPSRGIHRGASIEGHPSRGIHRGASIGGRPPWQHPNPGVSGLRMHGSAVGPLALPGGPGSLRGRELGAVDGTDPLGSIPELHVPPRVQRPDASAIPRAHPRPAVPR